MRDSDITFKVKRSKV